MQDGNKFFNEKKFNSAKEHDYRCAVKEPCVSLVPVASISSSFDPDVRRMG